MRRSSARSSSGESLPQKLVRQDLNRDPTLAGQGRVALAIFLNLITGLLYGFLDPRVRLA